MLDLSELVPQIHFYSKTEDPTSTLMPQSRFFCSNQIQREHQIQHESNPATLFPERARPDELPHVSAALQVAQQDFRAGPAVAVGAVVIEAEPKEIAHVIQPVADARQEASAHLHRADIAGVRAPVDLIVEQALFQNAHVEGCVMRAQQAAGHDRLDFLPEFGEGRREPHRLFADAGQPHVEVVEARFGVDQRIEFVHDHAVLDDGDPDGTYSIAIAVRRFHVENNET